jgi:hypothetical protein
MGQRWVAERTPLRPCGGVLALPSRVRPPFSATPPRALYDEDGQGLSWLARRLAGHRISCSGLVGQAPSGSAGWLAIGEGVLLPCPGCGGAHHWPVGVLAVELRQPPPGTNAGGPFAAATVQGVLDAAPGASAPAGMAGRLALRDATITLL